MGLLTYLLGQFWPAILAGLGILGGWLWHSARVTQAERRGEERATTAVTARNAEVNRQQAQVVRPKEFRDLTARLRERK